MDREIDVSFRTPLYPISAHEVEIVFSFQFSVFSRESELKTEN